MNCALSIQALCYCLALTAADLDREADSTDQTESPSTAADYQPERMAGWVDRQGESPNPLARRMKPKRPARVNANRATAMPET